MCEANSECCWHAFGGRVSAGLFVPIYTNTSQSNTNRIKTYLQVSITRQSYIYTYGPDWARELTAWSKTGHWQAEEAAVSSPGPRSSNCPRVLRESTSPWGRVTVRRMHRGWLLTFRNDATKKKLPFKVKFGKNEFLQAYNTPKPKSSNLSAAYSRNTEFCFLEIL